MKVSYNWLKEYVDKLPQPQKMADLLTMHSFEVKGLEKTENDCLFDIDVLPNRAHDCLSHIGISRECAALSGAKFAMPKIKIIEDKKAKTEDLIKIEVREKELCPRYTARIIENVKIGPSPKWLKERMKSIGQNSINNIVDATNFVMFETGQPLHALDYAKIQGKKIIVRRAKKGEKITTLDGESCELDESVLVIADNSSPLALAGVKGGKKAEITGKTKTIMLESANFQIKGIRNTFRKTGIKTESSIRFEHGLDPNLTSYAIDRVAEIIQAVAGGKIAKGFVDIYPKKTLPKKLKLNLSKAEGIMGLKISQQKAIGILKSLGFEVNASLIVTIPTVRQDVEIEEDLIEEVARIIGYNNIPAVEPMVLVGVGRMDDDLVITNKTKAIFESLGFTEVYNLSFVGENDLEKFGLHREGFLELENPLSVDLKYLRKDLLVNLLKNVKDNAKFFLGSEQGIKIFELGKVYCRMQKKDESVKEVKMLSGIIAAKEEKTKGEKFYELKGVIDSLLNKLGISDQWYDDFQATPEWTEEIFWQKTSTAEIKVGNEEIGFLGEINSRILNKLNIKGTVVAFDLNFEKLLKLAEEELIYEPPSPYPAAVRDLAILVGLNDKVADVLETIQDAGGALVQDVDLFDMYEGEEIPDNKKSLAFHIIYQSYEKTLKDEEVDKIHRKIVRELEKNKDWQVRK